MAGWCFQPTLKNDGLRQLGWWNSQLNGTKKSMVPNYQTAYYTWRTLVLYPSYTPDIQTQWGKKTQWNTSNLGEETNISRVSTTLRSVLDDIHHHHQHQICTDRHIYIYIYIYTVYIYIYCTYIYTVYIYIYCIYIYCIYIKKKYIYIYTWSLQKIRGVLETQGVYIYIYRYAPVWVQVEYHPHGTYWAWGPQCTALPRRACRPFPSERPSCRWSPWTERWLGVPLW